MLRAPAELAKCLTVRVKPMAPEFALLLAETPPQERTGPVFPLTGTRIKGRRPKIHHVSDIISAIGKKARVVVHVDPTDPGKLKYVSARDLRRTFLERWAARIMLEQLQELVGHETTLRYYVGRNAERNADVCWEAFERAQVSAAANRQP